jgi:hypothetical protein
MEKLVQEVPDVVLIELGLMDIAGDELILRLSQACQKLELKCILYTRRNDQHDRKVLEKIEQKVGVLVLIEYEKPVELLRAVDKLLS